MKANKDQKAQFEEFLAKKFKVDAEDPTQIPDIARYPTGIVSFDIAAGIGGLPKGSIVEIFGPESSGKSLTALKAVAYAQKRFGLPSLYLDLEAATPPDWLQRLGVDLNLLTVIKADPDLYAEKVLDIIEEAVKANTYAYVVVDSVVGLVPKAELEETNEKVTMGLLARNMSKAIRKVVPHIANSETCVIFINQIRDKVGVMYGSTEQTPGGHALKFYASQRYRVTKKSGSDVKQKGAVIGHTVKIKNKKNKLGPPQCEAEYPLFYQTGVDNVTNLVKYSLKYGIVQKDGYTYKFSGVNNDEEFTINVKGKEAFTDELRKNESAQELLYDEILQKFRTGVDNEEEEENVQDNYDPEFDD